MERPRMTSFSQVEGPRGTVSNQLSLVPSMHSLEQAKEAFPGELGRFLDQTDGVARSEQLFGLLSAFALQCECPWVAYSSHSADQILKSARQASSLMSYPDAWQEHYIQMGYDSIDPIIKKSRKELGAFRWSEVYNDVSTTEAERRFFDEAATFGLKSGISVPFHGPGVDFSIMSFARPSCRDLQNKTITDLQLAALHFHLRVARIVNSRCVRRAPNLSLREQECIPWAARGKSSWDIGVILGISEHTVNFHIKKVLRKLDVTSLLKWERGLHTEHAT
ncbi:LuxR family transcriptional regulator (plasmid) [Sinorhizobium numidicum]|uniref:LuxR family transcriptional regulator n=1 Tax=Sinorhizobium numidicum TaxID=680248 RepID=A0ABY8D360_9HYPH|nr:LuxR family transcriptional regulator [Sinorhizobium numidicum]WEX79304.1 LuxR family transcriptional regulator [Sinorhizobium numidicum]WEX85325.1 LuxR family transcriptional regulator [Sinorhizobium numidicum]